MAEVPDFLGPNDIVQFGKVDSLTSPEKPKIVKKEHDTDKLKSGMFVRVTAGEKRAFTEVSAKCGESFSAWARRLLRGAAGLEVGLAPVVTAPGMIFQDGNKRPIATSILVNPLTEDQKAELIKGYGAESAMTKMVLMQDEALVRQLALTAPAKFPATVLDTVGFHNPPERAPILPEVPVKVPPKKIAHAVGMAPIPIRGAGGPVQIAPASWDKPGTAAPSPPPPQKRVFVDKGRVERKPK